MKNIFLFFVFCFLFQNIYFFQNNANAKAKKIFIPHESFEKFSSKSYQYDEKNYYGPRIVLKGSNNISDSMIKRLIANNFDKKKSFSQSDLNKLLILLYETNLFYDIKLDYVDGVLYLDFVENKIIRKFEIHGDKDLKDKSLKDAIQLKCGYIFNEFEFHSTIKKISDFYKNNGYFNVSVEKTITDVPGTNFLDIDIKIVKGKAPKISEIIFIGNKNIDTEKLKSEILFREKGILKIFSKKTRFNKVLTKFNNENIEKFYKRYGFLDFKLLNQETIFDPRTNEIKLVFEVEEGDQFFIYDIEIDSCFELNKEIIKIINSSKNKVFNQLKLENDSKIIARILSRNKINADVTFSSEKCEKTGKIKVIFKISEAQNIFIDHINIFGNGRTKDSVIRNQITIHEGDLFNAESLETSYRRIYNLGFFESVNLDYKKSKNNQDMIDLFINVEEKKTGELHLGGGYSSLNGIFAEATYHENNIMGTGNIIGFGVQGGHHHFSLSGSYFQNNIFNTILGGGLSAFYDDYKNERLHFSNKDYGGSLSTSVPLYEDLYLKFRYLLKFNKIYNVSENASETVKKQNKNTTSSSFMYQLVYDKRDLIDYPTSGYYLNFSQDFNGLGGDKHFVSSEASAKFYKTLFHLSEIKSNKNAIVFQWKNSFGIINPYNDYILKIEDRFFLSEFRGFRQITGVSPMDKEKKVIGGDKYFFGSAQIEAPINLIQDFDLKAHIFLDYGKLWVDRENIFSKEDIMNDNAKIFSSKKMRISAGAGFYMITPFAPINIAFGYPLKWEKDLDHKKYIYFSLNKRI